MTYKCKICGGQTTVDTQNGIAICEYCGTKQALPLFSDNSERLLYESGNNYLLHSEYDKAENVFNQLLTINPNAAELYWDLVLCKYGVTYVKDPKTDKYIPTCNRTHYTPIFSDENYKKAIELSAGEKKSLFEEDAKTIDNIQKGIIAVSKKEKPFDIFISYKETDANGNRTKDSIEAQKLYEKLTESGYKVFFSRITLEDKIGTEYEPYIYAALYSSKVMLTICSSKENIEAVWVKNEWGRFLSLQQKSAEKTLIPLYFDMDKSDLPDEFSLIPSFNIKEDGFEAELIRGIKKQIPLPIMLAKKRKARRKTLAISTLSFLAVAIVCGAFFLPGFIKDQKYGKVYNEALQLFSAQNYTDAKSLFGTITDYKDAEYMIERCEIQPKYDSAMQLYYDGNYAEATWAFAELGDYEDATEQKEKSELSWRKSLADVYASGCYIAKDGMIESINDFTSTKYSNNNGKSISLIETYSLGADFIDDLMVIYENGQVAHEKTDSLSNDPEFHNIIKMGAMMENVGMVALRSDGKMIPFSIIDDNYSKHLEPLSSWENIIDFKCTFHGYFPAREDNLIVGLKSDGTLCAVKVAGAEFKDTYLNIDMKQVEKTLGKCKNVKKFAISDTGLTVVALTNDNKLITCTNGEYHELSEKGVCDIISTNLALKSNGDLIAVESGKVIMRDVIYAGKTVNEQTYYILTRSGTIFVSYPSEDAFQLDSLERKAIVYEEWESRLN